MTILPDKAQRRAHFRSLRNAIPPDDRAAAAAEIHARLLDSPIITQANTVFCYINYASEVQTDPLLQTLMDAGKTLAVPLITGPGHMQAHRITDLANLAPGAYKILAPTRPDPLPGSPDLTILPGLAFTPQGDRLGQGAGFYDRFLAAHPTTFPLALAFDQQITDHLPTQSHDIPMKTIITPTQTLTCPPRN